MIAETLALVALLALLTVLGLGPALVLLRPPDHSLRHILGLAPATGLTMIGLLGFPLARYLGPVRTWTWPATTGLLVLSLGLLVYAWRRAPGVGRPLLSRTVTTAVGVTTAVTLLLALPMLRFGIQYATWRSNPSDAFLYMSLAESLRVVPWPTLLAGADFGNAEGVRELAAVSPTALFTARMVRVPLALNNMAALAWLTELARLPVHRFYYAYHLLSFVAAFPALVVLGRRLALARSLAYLAAAAGVLGFWARYVLESDSSYQIATVPTLALAVCAWALVETESSRGFGGGHLLLALTCAAIASYYSPMLLVLAVGIAAYVGLAVVQRVRPIGVVWSYLLVAGTGAAVLLLTGQLDYHVRSGVFHFVNVRQQAAFGPFGTDLIRANGVAALWGMPSAVIGPHLPDALRWLAEHVFLVGGYAVTAAAMASSVLAMRPRAPAAERVVLALAAAGLALMAIMWANHNWHGGGKALTYVWPYLAILVALFVEYVRRRLGAAGQFAVVSVTAWLVGQSLLGLLLGHASLVNRALKGVAKTNTYDVSPITRELASRQPRRMLVAVPRPGTWGQSEQETWPFPFYVMFVFASFGARFQSGLIIDNQPAVRNWWTGPLNEAPDYVVVSKAADYMAGRDVGRRLAETPDLALYHVTSDDVELFRAEEVRLQRLEAARPRARP
jgi:hypothetical protein